ncbi:hypothetical protein GGI22_001541, partial [Coemansia erecta]
MSSRALRRTKSPANRNRFNDIGVTGRKTGVRVAGDVRVDEDGLENVEEFYKQTSPHNNANDENQEGKALRTRTLHTLLSPTPIRSTANHDTLMGALDMPSSQTGKADEQSNTTTLANISTADDVMEDEATVSPLQARAMRVHQFNRDLDSHVAANRRTTLAPLRQNAREAEWMHSPRKGRRVTMAFMKQNGSVAEPMVELTDEASAAVQGAEYDDNLSPEIGAIDAAKDGF